MLSNTYLIGKHLHLPKDAQNINRCCVCNNCGVGFKKKDVISASFRDCDYLNESEEICIYCAVCIGKGLSQNEQLRLFSFIATEDRLQILKRESIWNNLFSVPNSPFVFGVTYGHKKHISFKAPICFSSDYYQIQTDIGRVTIDIQAINGLTEILQKWYSICKDTKQEPTWFTKNDILLGCRNFKRIEEYGVVKYFQENKLINLFRKTALLELLCYALNKKRMAN